VKKFLRFRPDVILAAFFTSMILLTGCTRTMRDVLIAREEGAGTTGFYMVNADQAWEIAKVVFRWEGADAIEEHREQNHMLTSSGRGAFTLGTVMGAWIEPIDQNQTKVTVITMRRVSDQIFTTLTETTFHKRFAQAVEIIKSGQSLSPLKKP
jgi:hypothetical protein